MTQKEILADHERRIKALEERVKELEAILELDMPKEPLDGESWHNPIQKYLHTTNVRLEKVYTSAHPLTSKDYYQIK